MYEVSLDEKRKVSSNKQVTDNEGVLTFKVFRTQL